MACFSVRLARAARRCRRSPTPRPPCPRPDGGSLPDRSGNCPVPPTPPNPAAVANGPTWGGVALHRRTGDPEFNEGGGLIARVARPWSAVGIRGGILTRRTGARPGPDLGPAVLIVDADGTIVQRNACADAWLDELDAGGLDAGAASSVASLVAQAKRFTRDEVSVQPSMRVRTHSGRWLVLNASALQGSVDGPPQVHLREGRCAQSARTDLRKVLRAVRTSHGTDVKVSGWFAG